MSAVSWAWATVLTMTAVTVWYCALIVLRRVSPAPAAWIIALVAMNLSFVAYWGTRKHTLIGNVTNLTAAVEIIVITGLILWSLWRSSELKISFDAFQWGSVIASVVIMMFWKQSFYLSAEHRSIAAFACVQAMLVLSYVVMVSKVLRLKKNTDSIVMWVGIATASVFGYCAAAEQNDIFGQINSLRAIVTSALLAAIMICFDLRNGRWGLMVPKYRPQQ